MTSLGENAMSDHVNARDGTIPSNKLLLKAVDLAKSESLNQ
jgi:hypothetical protein